MTTIGLAQDAVQRRQEPDGVGLTIRISAGVGTARTPLAAFDAALWDAGTANFNLVRLSSVIPPGSRVIGVSGNQQLSGGHGDLLYCVYAVDVAVQPGQTVWAGVGWSLARDGSGSGLFVEHTAVSKAELEQDIAISLDELARHRGGGYALAGTVTTSATCTDRPAAAVVIATYRSEGWR